MKKQKKVIVPILIFLTILLSSCKVFATSITDYIEEMQFSENYLKYLELSDEERENTIVPRMYEIPKSKKTVTNPLKFARKATSAVISNYSLRTVIPENMVVKNQGETGTCYAFSILAALESTLALKDYKNGNSAILYDLSERHMEYATSRTFLNGVINEKGYAREVGDGGPVGLPIAYLTNGTGAIAEAEMPFENNENKIDISEIQNKTVVTQINDTIDFPSYSVTEDTTDIKRQMKEHIRNYGAIDAGIHGAEILSDCYNKETGAIYCNDDSKYEMNHAVIIVGWDDNYSKENFNESNRPSSDGAWVIRNSWGTDMKITLIEAKELLYQNAIDNGVDMGWTSELDVPDDMAIETIEQNGFTYNAEEQAGIFKIGDDGFMYVSYEDVYIYSSLTGIVDAQTEITYENIYQYDYYGSFLPASFDSSKLYLATIFDKKTEGTEYLTQVGINASETYTCKVYVNPNGTSKSINDLQQVQLKSGEKETFDAGYHTIEFLNPIKITGDKFVVALEIEGTQEDSISTMMEFNFGEYFTDSFYDNAVVHCYDNVTVENEKCFMAIDPVNDGWCDTSTMNTISNGNLPNFDTTIKAFTTSKVLEGIEITTPPTKTSYVVGQNFDKTGMIVKGNYANGDIIEIADYTIEDGANLSLGQTSVTISYNGFSITQPIEVEKNTVESIAVTTVPKNIEYYAGDNFDTTDMIVEATYKDGTTKTVTDYTIEDGMNLKNGQMTVTISYDGKITTQEITVKANQVIKLEVVSNATKLNYVVGQDFNTEGLIIKATYESGLEKEITASDYTIKDGTDLKENQTTVTIEFEGQTITQEITVVAKAVTGITVKTMPTKTEYIQNTEELDLTGGVIEITYNDDSKEELVMTSSEIIVNGFDNKEVGTQTINLTYQGMTSQFDIEIKELEKPENSNFDNMQGNVKRIRTYNFTDANEKGYTVINVELDNIIKSTENENVEYYYYLSANQQETGIVDWVKIDSIEIIGDKLSFEINTADILNYEEVANANNLYLYVKEVATRNNMKTELVTSSVLLEVKNIKVEEYVDGQKKSEVDPGTITDPTPGKDEDNTVSSEKIPYAGKSILTIFVVLAIIVLGRLVYLRYKDIEIK